MTTYSITVNSSFECSDYRLYHPENIESLSHLLELEDSEFPFTEDAVKTLKTAQKTDQLISHEYLMNYSRFFIGAAFGVIATVLVGSKTAAISPSLLTGVGAAVSGSLGLVVTLVRAQNLSVASQTRASVITSLFEKHMRIGATLTKMSAHDVDLAKNIAEELDGKLKMLEGVESFHNLKKKEILYLSSPLQEAVNRVLLGKAPLYPFLDHNA